MKKLRIYLDTSVLNFALSEDPSLKIQKKATIDLLDDIKQGKYEGYISEQVLVEINRAPKAKAESLNNLVSKLDIASLSLDEAVEELADKYVKEGLIPVKYRDDALHIAIASVNDLDAVISWNFEHMVKLKTKHGVIAVNALLGYKLIDIVSPQEVG
ncbi:MAG TPA: PIN domain-containing protein [Candidatus Brocadiales bacterium]|nr:PIN domain-containing protein [Candidatus Brocadiales bacterium]